LTTDIRIDNEEMMDVRWFTRADVLSALRGDHPHLHVPEPIAIAHHLIKTWAEGDVRWE
jgi:NAD+ diphosphatase